MVGYCKKVEEVEVYYWETDEIVSDVIEKNTITSDQILISSTIISSDNDYNTDSNEAILSVIEILIEKKKQMG